VSQWLFPHVRALRAALEFGLDAGEALGQCAQSFFHAHRPVIQFRIALDLPF
jgi:hypothetical protein